MSASTLRATLDFFRSLRGNAGIKTGRHFEAFFADRLAVALAAPTLVDAAESLARGLDAAHEFVGGAKVAAFMGAASAPDAEAVLLWLRAHPRVAAMICGLRVEDDYAAALDSLPVADIAPDDGSAVAAVPAWQIPIRAECAAPLHHGAEEKRGNASLFRRQLVVTATGRTLSLPVYAGNAVRGQIRDLLADHLLRALGLSTARNAPSLALWFFHTLYSGGVLEESSPATKAIQKELGQSGALRAEGLRRWREMLPALSLLGCALGNKVLPGRVSVGALRPVCREWGFPDARPAVELFGWEFYTRRDDHEGRGEEQVDTATGEVAEQAHRGMIVQTECLRPGTALVGGIDIDTHANDLERAALGLGLRLLTERGMLGASNRQGWGKVHLTHDGAPDPAPYLADLEARRDAILTYLGDIGALAA